VQLGQGLGWSCWVTHAQVAAGREVLLGKEDLPGVLRRTENQPKSAIAPTDGQEMLSSCVLKLLEV
jgi:hypothetical protein